VIALGLAVAGVTAALSLVGIGIVNAVRGSR
jgi:hypothetical protein